MLNLKTAVGPRKKVQDFDPEPLYAGVAFTLEFGLILGYEDERDKIRSNLLLVNILRILTRRSVRSDFVSLVLVAQN